MEELITPPYLPICTSPKTNTSGDKGNQYKIITKKGQTKNPQETVLCSALFTRR